MERFPLTDAASLGGTVCGSRHDQWRTRLLFGPNHMLHREHIPEFIEIEKAELVLQGAGGRCSVTFPRKQWLVDLPSGSASSGQPIRLDVSEGLAVGRHNFEVRAEGGGDFSAELNISLRRPTVPVRDGGYVIPGQMMKYSHTHWLEDDRSAQRVGRFAAYVKTIPQHFDGTQVDASISINGTWKYKPIDEMCIDDCSTAAFDDSALGQHRRAAHLAARAGRT